MSSSRLTIHRLWRLSLKELKETCRDRRTIITLCLMPILVYPLLSMAMNRYLLSSGETTDAYRIGVDSPQDGEYVLRILEDPRANPPDALLQASGGNLAEFEIFDTTQVTDGSQLSPVEALEFGKIDLAIEIDFEEEIGIRLISFTGDSRSQNARRVLLERIEWQRLAVVEEIASQANSYAYKPPPSIEVVDHGEPKDMPILATIVPLVLVLMTITGAVYPAIDLTAGERERGTMEALMASPVPRFQVLLAKYVAVVAVAMLTAIANLLAMFTTLWLGGLLPLLTGGEGFPWSTMLQILALLVLFSGFFSAVLLSLTSFARSFKEAQAYLIPVMLLSITPGMLSLLPGVSLAGPLAVAPLINIVLLARELLSSTVNPAAATIAVISTIGYAGVAIAVAANLFGSDAVTRTSEQSFASILKRPKVSSLVPSPQAAAAVLALLVPIYFVLSNVLMQYLTDTKSIMLGGAEELSMGESARLQVRSMTLSAIALIAVFGLVPFSVAWFCRNQLETTYRWRWPRIGSIIGAIIVGLGAWAIAHEAFVFVDWMGIGGLSEEKIEQTRKVLKAWTLVPPWVLLATLAVTPAVIEELCFRGFLFSAFRRVLTPLRTILLTSFLFALFHVLTGNALLIERFVPSFLLGIVLGAIAYRTGSVIPGMAMHFVHNGLLELVGHYHEKINFLGADFDNQTHLPLAWIVGATAIAVSGGVLVWWSTSNSQTESLPSTIDPAA